MKPRAPSKRPSKAKIAFALGISLLFLGAATGLFFLALGYRRKYAEWMRKEKGRLQAAPLLDYARDNLERADRFSRLPSGDPEDVKGLSENVIVAATRAAELRPDLEEPYRLRARALELQYRFDEAEGDYERALRLHPASYASLQRGLLGVRRLARRKLLGDRAAEPDEVPQDDLRRYLFHSSGEIQDERNRFVASAALGYLLGEHATVPMLCETALRLDPTEWLLPFLEGLAYLAQGKEEEALKAFDTARDLSSYAAEVHAYRAQVLRMQKDHLKASDAIDAAIQRDDQFTEAYYLRGTIAFESRRYDEAREDFRQAGAPFQMAQSGLEAWLQGGRKDHELLEEVLEELAQVLHADPEARASRARALVESGRFEQALPDVEAILTANPKRLDILHLRVRIHVQRKNWEAADRDLTALGNLRERARVRALAGRMDDAIADLDLLLFQDPRDSSLYLEKARLQLGAGREGDAVETLDRLEQVHSSFPAAKVVRAELLFGKGDFASAIRLTTEAIQSDPQMAEALLIRGRAYQALGEADAAQRDFARALEINPALRDRIPQTP